MKVDARAVEAELSRLQRELTNSEVRTSLFNLVVMSPDAERAMVDEALTYILGKRAARVIHIVNKGALVESSSLEVSARCYIDHERKGVCFEEVIITNGKDGAGGAPGSWTPLLIRDIPTFVLWMDAINGREQLFVHARNQSDKVIVDGDLSVSLGDDPDTYLRTLARIAAGSPLIDFSWKRLLPVRKLLADAFAGDRVELLGEIIAVRAVGLRPVSSRLLGLWLAERLGWKPDDDGPIGNRFRDLRGRTVVFTAAENSAAENSAADSDCEISLEVELESGDHVDLTAGLSGCAEIDFPGGTERPYVVLPSSGEILLEEVDAVSADTLFRRALATVPAT